MKVCQLISTGVYLVMVVFLFKCGPVIANPVTTSSAESVSAVTNKYELMDISVSSCRKVWSVFEPKNLTDQLLEYPEDGTGLSVCRSRTSCCTHQMEERLKTHVQRDFKALLHHSSQTIQGLLISTANDLQDHVTRLARDSENRTQSLFADVYRGMAARAREPIARLFRGLTEFARAGSAAGDQLTAIPPDDGDRLVDVVERFFGELFPLVYHQAVHSHSTAFTRDYARCVGDAASSVQPYGAAPRRLGETLAASLQRTRTFAQALLMAGQVMNTTDRLMDETSSKGLDNCFGALLRLTYCPRCQGLDTAIKPCNGYCLNVVRGCLTQQRAQELDLPWNNFLVETERLAKHILADNLQSLQMLASSISDAVMYAVMDGLQIDAKVKKLCGPARLEPETEETKKQTPKTDDRNVLNGISVSSLAAGHHNKPLEHESPLLTSFLHSLDSIQAKGFFANLPEALCSDESFAEIHDTAECWNGQRVGEYTKTLVRPGVDAQKYNPELAWTESEPDPIIHQLSDKLRHIRQVVMGQLNQAQNLVSESYLRDEEGGSGSGQKPDDDDDDDTEWAQGSGSGNIPGEEQSTKKKTYATDGIDLNTNITPGQGNNSNGQLTPTGKGRGSSPLHTSNLQLFTLIATALLTTYATNTLTSMLYTRTRH